MPVTGGRWGAGAGCAQAASGRERVYVYRVCCQSKCAVCGSCGPRARHLFSGGSPELTSRWLSLLHVHLCSWRARPPPSLSHVYPESRSTKRAPSARSQLGRRDRPGCWVSGFVDGRGLFARERGEADGAHKEWGVPVGRGCAWCMGKGAFEITGKPRFPPPPLGSREVETNTA